MTQFSLGGSLIDPDPDSEAGRQIARWRHQQELAELKARVQRAEDVATRAAMNSEIRTLLADHDSLAHSTERALLDLDEAYRFAGEMSMQAESSDVAENQRKADARVIEAAARLDSVGGEGRSLAQHLYLRRLLVLGGMVEELVHSARGGGWDALRLTRQLLEAIQSTRTSGGGVLDLAFKSPLERRIFEVLITDDGLGYRSAGSTAEKIQERYPDETYEKGVDRRTVSTATKRMKVDGWPIEITNKGARFPRAARRRLPPDLVEG